jgi:GNAT superfamily N-acetyltransferase
VGHIAFSPVTISDGSTSWHALGPVSVLPDYQRRGIGKALIREGIAPLKGLGAGVRVRFLVRVRSQILTITPNEFLPVVRIVDI